MTTDYKDLSEEEQDSNRKEAAKFLKLFKKEFILPIWKIIEKAFNEGKENVTVEIINDMFLNFIDKEDVK